MYSPDHTQTGKCGVAHNSKWNYCIDLVVEMSWEYYKGVQKMIWIWVALRHTEARGGSCNNGSSVMKAAPLRWKHLDAHRHTESIKQKAKPTQWRLLVLPSSAVWIYWLLCGEQFHPSCKKPLSRLFGATAPVFWLFMSGAEHLRCLLQLLTIIMGELWEPLGACMAGSATAPECWLRARSSVQSAHTVSREEGRDGKGYWRRNEEQGTPWVLVAQGKVSP